MAKGAQKPIRSRHIEWWYKQESSLPTLPADIAGVNTSIATFSKLEGARPGTSMPGVNAGAAATPNIEWEELGEAAVQYAAGLTPAPTADENTMEIVITTDFTDETHVALVTAAAGTYAQLFCIIQTDDGDGTRGDSAGNAQGTVAAFVVQHADAPVNVPAGTEVMTETERFTIVDDSAGAKGRKLIHYGPP